MTLRRWQLNATRPYSLEIAADARLSSTDYTDDQVWRLALGSGESPALALQTQYGGRVGLASIVPMWTLDNRVVYQAQGYAKPPVIVAFAPGFLQVQAAITPQIGIRAEYWVMDSHAVGARYTFANNSSQPLTLRVELFGHVGAGGKELKLGIMTLPDGAALSMGKIGRLQPVVVMEGTTNATSNSRIGRDLTIPAKGNITLRWVHAGLATMKESAALARQWLNENWTDAFKRIAEAAQAIPTIETGDDDLDAAIAFSYQQVMQAFLRPTSSLPHASFVAARQPDRGFSPRGDGRDHIRTWNGQAATTAYLTALAAAPVNAELAQGIIRNYLAVQQDDGTIDGKPGLAGQKQGALCMPILARLAWGIFQYTEDVQFLREVFPGLLRFFERWFVEDADKDGLPEWTSEAQTGYPYFPTFAVTQPWGQHVSIQTVESPDLMAYLLSEAMSLREIAYFLNDQEHERSIDERINSLKAALESLWRDDRYAYQDRDTHTTTASVTVLDGVPGNEEQFPAMTLSPANRLIVRVVGGLEHVPAMTLNLEGLDAVGQPVTETASSDEFIWTHGRGVYTSKTVFSEINRIWFDGLIQVYKVYVQTVDTTRLDINALLPLWSVGIPPERAAALVKLLTDPQHFWRENGVTMCSAQDPAFDPANADGSGGVWPFWLTLIGEGLIETGNDALAADVLARLLKVQVAVLKAQKEFSEFYHSDSPLGPGERGHVAGVVPLHLLMRVAGVRIISARKVWVGGTFAWSSPITITQHGVQVRRSAEGTRIQFPSGQVVELGKDASWQEVLDSEYKES